MRVNPHIAPVSRIVALSIHGSRDIRMFYTSLAPNSYDGTPDWTNSHSRSYG